MKKIKVLFAIICITLMATMTPLTSHADIPVTIDVAPNVINLGSSSTWVTVHADIPYADVTAGSVTLTLYVDESPSANVDPVLCFADDRGDFVAKFDMEAVRALIGIAEEGRNNGASITFGLTGDTYGEIFSGSQDILVFNNNKK